MNLFVSYFEDKERQDEFEYCLKRNVENEHIKRIFLLYETENLPDCVNHPKVELIEPIQRPTYGDFFELFVEGEVNILANSDIFFDDTIQHANKITGRTCYALTRHEFRNQQIKPFSDVKPQWSQDVWIFRNAPKPIGDRYKKVIALNLATQQHEVIGFYLGVPGCDNHIAYLLNHYDLINPYNQINALHVHGTDERNYKLKYRITGNRSAGFGQLKPVNIKPI